MRDERDRTWGLNESAAVGDHTTTQCQLKITRWDVLCLSEDPQGPSRSATPQLQPGGTVGTALGHREGTEASPGTAEGMERENSPGGITESGIYSEETGLH